MKWYTVTRLGDHSNLTPEGFLVVRDVAIARCGKQIYWDNELDLEPDDNHQISIERDPSEVFKADSIASFEGKPITDDHPFMAVDPDNFSQLAIGHVSNARRGTGANHDVLIADLMFTTRRGIAAVQSGKRAVSVGYDAHYEQTGRGTGRQRNIIANHLALVDEGRCGPRCTIHDGITIYNSDAAGFVESEHPREDDGKFTTGGGGGHAGKSVTFSKKNPAQGDLHGVKFEKWQAPTTHEGWEAEAAAGPDFDEPEAPDTKGKKLASGVIAREKDGRTWIMRPKNAFGGYKASFPKGGVDKGLSMRANAIKEAYEETGLRVRLTGYATDVARSTSHARYYHAERIGGTPSDHGWETEGVTLAPHNELHQHLNQPVDRRLARQALGDVDEAPLKLADMQKVGKQLGSNPGGQYTDSQGKKYYVKQSKSNDHAKNEILAARLYEAAGAPILHAMPVDMGDGKLGTATEWRDVGHTINHHDQNERREAQRHFATHAWLANWDAAGLDYDNQGTVDHEMHTLDPGGSMLYRAQGSPKGKAWGDEVGEWHTLRDAGVNPQNHKLFGEMSDKRLKRSAENVTRIPDKEIRRLTMKHGPGTETEKQALADRLIARKGDIGKKAGALTGDRKPRHGVILHFATWRRRLAA